MLRRLAPHQPETFAFTPANRAWAEAQITKYPPGRQASAIIPLLWRAQEQEGWLSRPAIEHVADMLGMAYIRALEVATFYFMFQLHPTGSVAHVQVCGTTSCMIMGAEDLVAVCERRIGKAHHPSADGKFSWEEVECLGACANAPMAQIGKDYYEDLTPEILERILDDLAAGRVPTPGPQQGRFASEPAGGITSLKAVPGATEAHNGSVALALAIGDTVKRIDGTEVPLTAPWQGKPAAPEKPRKRTPAAPDAAAAKPEVEADQSIAKPDPTPAPTGAAKPLLLTAARGGGPDDLKRIKGVGPKLEALLHRLGVFHFDQIAAWTKAEIAWVDAALEGFKGRVSRDGWVAQAKILATGGETALANRDRT
jgi:NADH-quinone oxidoreductase subunit E